MLRRYELTDDEWNRVAPLLHLKILESKVVLQNVIGQF